MTDKVWHELAFGLESLGLDNQSIRRRVAEMASFDIQTWFRQERQRAVRRTETAFEFSFCDGDAAKGIDFG